MVEFFGKKGARAPNATAGVKNATSQRQSQLTRHEPIRVANGLRAGSRAVFPKPIVKSR
jgi:hypothetical protein